MARRHVHVRSAARDGIYRITLRMRRFTSFISNAIVVVLFPIAPTHTRTRGMLELGSANIRRHKFAWVCLSLMDCAKPHMQRIGALFITAAHSFVALWRM